MTKRDEQLQAGVEPFPGYRLRQSLGRGGFGEVWEATTPEGGPVALKFLPCDGGTATPQEIRALQLIRKVSHPNLVTINQIWCYRQYIVISMELADGSLDDLLLLYQEEFGTPIPPDHLCLCLGQVADVLDFLNTRQHHIDGKVIAIQHCDVKPSNMLLFGETTKLSDFGLSSQISLGSKTHRRAGTAGYAAPEVVQGGLSNRTDQYALAVSYCLLRGGRLPFPDSPESFRRDYLRPAPDLSMLPEAERPIVARALATVPLQRWPSCRKMIDELCKTFVQPADEAPG